jgi:sulfite reductase (ferredoxin)
MAYFMLRHPDAQNFGRKFKIAFSGCADHACGLARMHDIGAIAKVREIDGKRTEGFEVWLGGGLGSLPHQAKLYSEFVPANQMLPMAQAIGRVFGRLGEKQNRSKARMKFLIAKLGIDEFCRLVDEERARLLPDERWESDLAEARALIHETPLKPPSDMKLPANADPRMLRWIETNVRPQRQQGYSMAEIFLPLGDIAADQLRGLANLCRRFVNETVRTTVEQNLLVRWISNADLPAFYEGLNALSLADAGAQRLMDITACPGTDSCKLGIASSRGLAADLHEKFNNGKQALGERNDLKIKISGCFNSCGQHHIADIGLFGSVQRKQNHTAPVFQVVLGGTMQRNAASYGLAVGKVPSHNAVKAIEKLSKFYSAEKRGNETLGDVVERVGKARLKEELEELSLLPAYEEAPEFYKDVRQPWEYAKNVGVGECAGEMVDQAEFMLEDADRLNFEATLALEQGNTQEAARKAYEALRKAADGLLSTKGLLLSDKYDTVSEFRKFFYDGPSVFWKPFAENFFRSAEENVEELNAEQCRLRVEEATLFIEQAQTVYSQM